MCDEAMSFAWPDCILAVLIEASKGVGVDGEEIEDRLNSGPVEILAHVAL